MFKQLSQSWKALSNAQILAWNKLAQSQAGRSVLGTSSKISGANLFMRLNYWIVFCGGDALANPPELVGVEAPGEAVISLATEKFTFELEQVPAAAPKVFMKYFLVNTKTGGKSGEMMAIARL